MPVGATKRIAWAGGLIAVVSVSGAALYEVYLGQEQLRQEADFATTQQAIGVNMTAAQVHDMSENLRTAGHTIPEFGSHLDPVIVFFAAAFILSMFAIAWGVGSKR